MKNSLTLPALLTVLLLSLSSVVYGQGYSFGLAYEVPQAPISSTDLENGFGVAMQINFPSLTRNQSLSLISVEPGLRLDYFNHGKTDDRIALLDERGVEQAVHIKNSSTIASGVLTFSLSDRFLIRPYLQAEVGARKQRTYEDWANIGGDDCLEDGYENVTIERNWAPLLGGGTGIMMSLGYFGSLDLGMTWRQTGNLTVVPLNSVQVKELHNYSYTTDTRPGQFIGFRASWVMPLTGGTDWCAPSRHQLETRCCDYIDDPLLP